MFRRRSENSGEKAGLGTRLVDVEVEVEVEVDVGKYEWEWVSRGSAAVPGDNAFVVGWIGSFGFFFSGVDILVVVLVRVQSVRGGER
jgi:hypothetical protein